jgi:hypothetical protein
MAPVTIESNSVCSVVNPKFLIRIVENDPKPPVGIWILSSPNALVLRFEKVGDERDIRNLNEKVTPDL